MNKRLALYFGSLLFILGALFSLVRTETAAAASGARDCDSNAIIYCGALTREELENKYSKNAPGDLPAIFSHYGISRADIKDATMKRGVIHRGGDVEVDGKIVATGAHSVGRQNMPGSRPVTIGGKTYYERSDTRNFNSPSIDAFVIMKNGKFYRAIMMSCGNPVVATPTPEPPKPTFECVELKVKELTRTKRTFTATAKATGGATIEKYEFGFGDGMGITVASNTYTYDYKKVGTFNTSVVVHFKVNGEIKKVGGPQCTAPVTIKPEPAQPVFACDSLMARLISKENRTYAFDLKYTAEGGATLRDADFAFGDGTSQNGVTPAQLSGVQHSYAKAGKYTAVATLHFNVANTVQDRKCEVTFDISPEACPLNPSLPKDSPDCQPCPLPGKENLPKNSPDCKETVLPAAISSTGPADFVIGGLGLSSLTAAGYYWRASRNRLIAKLLAQ